MKKVIAATAIALGMSTTANAIDQSSEADRIWMFSKISMLCSATDVVLKDYWFEMAKEMQAEVGVDYKPLPISESMAKKFIMRVAYSPSAACGGDQFAVTQNLLMEYRINQ